MGNRIAVLGAGAIGSSVGADLTNAGVDVSIVDQWPAQVDVMKETGLRIRMPDEDLRVRVNAFHLCELASLRATFDVVLLTVKAYDTRWMTELIKPYLAENGTLVAMQNGMTNEIVSSIVGSERTVGCVVELSADIFEPGDVKRDTTRDGTWLGIGELDGSVTARVKEIQSLLSNVATVDVVDNIQGAKWTKLVVNSMTMGPFGLFGLTNWEAKELPGMVDISAQIGKESHAVGVALGYRLEPVFGLSAEEFAGSSDAALVKAMETLMAHIGKNSITAPVHDHRKGRKSEMEFINGEVVRRGKQVGVPTPINDIVMDIDRKINAGEVEMDVSNVDLLKTRMAALETGG